jgi:salicylate hydroxylase
MAIETKDLPVLVAGGGIGGLAAALALVRQGFEVQVLEQAPEIGEIGAGIQLGPNAFHAFDALGVGDKARGRAVYTDYMVMHDAIDETEVGKIPTGEAFRQRFGNPYAVIHRVDMHPRCWKARWKPAGGVPHQHPHGAIEQDEAGTVTVIDQNGKRLPRARR